KRVAAARVRVLLPDRLPRRQQVGVARSEPVERVDQPGRAVFRDDRLRGVARAAAGQQAEDAGATALLLIAVPEGAERQRRAERARLPGQTPEPLRELKQCL